MIHPQSQGKSLRRKISVDKESTHIWKMKTEWKRVLGELGKMPVALQSSPERLGSWKHQVSCEAVKWGIEWTLCTERLIFCLPVNSLKTGNNALMKEIGDISSEKIHWKRVCGHWRAGKNHDTKSRIVSPWV